MRYFSELPARVPNNGTVIVHNAVRASWEDQTPGLNGFRAWAARSDAYPNMVSCRCGWSGLPHYRIRLGDTAEPPSVKGKRMPRAQTKDDQRTVAASQAKTAGRRQVGRRR